MGVFHKKSKDTSKNPPTVPLSKCVECHTDVKVYEYRSHLIQCIKERSKSWGIQLYEQEEYDELKREKTKLEFQMCALNEKVKMLEERYQSDMSKHQMDQVQYPTQPYSCKMMLQQKKKRTVPNTGLAPSSTINPTLLESNIQQQQITTPFKTQVVAELPYLLKNAIEQLDIRVLNTICGQITHDALVYIILQNELFIWSIDKPQNCERLILPSDDLHENQITVFRNPTSHDQFSAFSCSKLGVIRYWSNTAKPNIIQEINIEGYNNDSDVNIVCRECSPYGMVIGNSLGNIHLVSIRQGVLTIKKINKAASMLSLSYFSKASPVITVFSSSNSSSNSSNSTVNYKSVFVLTESTLYKYEISNNSNEKITYECQYLNEIPKCFNGIRDMKTIGMYAQTQYDQKNQEVLEVIHLLHYTLDPSNKPNSSRITFYTMKIELSNNRLNSAISRTNFSPRFEITNNEIKSIRLSKLYIKDSKYYLLYGDKIIFQSTTVESKVRIDSIICSGMCQDALYMLNLESGISNFDIKPFNQDIVIRKERTAEEKSLNQPIIFDVLQSDEALSASTNQIFKTLNSISLKQQNKIMENLALCKGIKDIEVVIRKVSRIILDLKPKSKFWADDGKSLGNLGSDISIQLKQQLEDKKKRHTFLVSSLNDFEFSEKQLSNTTVEYLQRNTLKIEATIALREYQTSDQQVEFIPEIIQKLVSERFPNWQNMGMNIFELFYSDVSAVDQLLITITNQLIHNQSNSELDIVLKIKYILHSANIFHKIVQLFPTTSYFYEIAQHESIFSTTGKFIDCLFAFIASDLPVAPLNLVVKNMPNFDVTMFALLYDLVYLYLTAWKLQDPNQYQQGKTYFITPFVNAKRYQQALLLANQFEDYTSIINIYDKDSSNKPDQIENLYQSLSQLLPNQSQLEIYYNKMLEKNLNTELLQMPDQFNDSISQFLVKHKHLQWIHTLRVKNFKKSSDILSQNSKDDNHLKSKKLQLSLSKLAAISSDKSYADKVLPEIDSQMNLVNHQLEYNLVDYKNINEFLSYILTQSQSVNFETLKNCLDVLDDSKLILSEESVFSLLKELINVALNLNEVFEIQNHSLSDVQFDKSLENTILFKFVSMLPKDSLELIKHCIQLYFTSVSSSLNLTEKRQLENSLGRILELLLQ
ncbi:nucleoporin [Tieghemostelium lacteum]|uniref:Nucleoporin n=1 Tax=Tieghemostelium lacteum TaxID=361077 RepID=A0A151ZSA1_TIELA|nr:nucleoporin [Tieghemostelium lacteum]|eukprot:KYQ96826.1 nucleoporin [Tieghemostelium lacteum]